LLPCREMTLCANSNLVSGNNHKDGGDQPMAKRGYLCQS